MYIFYYFLQNLSTGVIVNDPPYPTDSWLGDVNDIISLHGNKFRILDYAVEEYV